MTGLMPCWSIFLFENYDTRARSFFDDLQSSCKSNNATSNNDNIDIRHNF